MELQLEDLVAEYPEANVPFIQTIISGKQEFKELASETREPIPLPGQYYKHQRFVLRYMNVTDRLLLIHEPGTGKTCSVVAVAEYFRRQAEKGLSHIKHVYFLTSGKTTKLELKNQILCHCTPRTYITEMVTRQTNEAQRKSAITREIEKWYTVETYRKFARSILSPRLKRREKKGSGSKTEVSYIQLDPLSDEQIIDYLSDTIIFVDEIHNIRGPLGDEENEELELNSNEQSARKERIRELQRVYQLLFKIFHLVPRLKVILASATPMINSVAEIGPIMNLLLPKDLQFPSNFDFNNATLERLEPYFRGRISYVRALDTGAVPQYEGEYPSFIVNEEVIEGKNKIYALAMSPLQAQGYKEAEKKNEGQAFQIGAQQASSFVYPDGSYGGSPNKNSVNPGAFGMAKYVYTTGREEYIATEELRNYLHTLDGIGMLSCKFAEIIKLTIEETAGNVFCYTNFLRGSGAIMLGLCFEGMGFERYQETTTLFQVRSDYQGLPSICASVSDVVKERIPRLDKRPRYALLSYETSEAEQASILEAFNSYENRHGEYIKVLIGTPVSQEGINLANVVQVHIITPFWHQSGIYQALSRAIRATSHTALLEEARAKAIERGEDPRNVTIPIKIYKYASVLEEEGAIIPTIDLRLYEVTEQKDKEIHRVLRIMKQCAIDCQINRVRNIRATDKEGSPACDYMKCNYECVDPIPDETDYSTYDVYYWEEVVEELIAELTLLFKERSIYTLDEIYEQLKGYRSTFINIALQQMIDRALTIYDRFGYTAFLQEDKGKYFLTREFNVKETYPVSYYSNTNFGILSSSLNDFLYQLQTKSLDEFKHLSLEDFIKTLVTLSPEIQAETFENAFIKPEKDERDKAILELYHNNYFELAEPIGLLRAYYDFLNRPKGRGRPSSIETLHNFNKILPRLQEIYSLDLLQEEGAPVYIHDIYAVSERKNVSYNVTTKALKVEGKLRIFKPGETSRWSDLNKDIEQPVYQWLLSQILSEKKEPFEEKFEVYGIYVSKKNQFLIRDRRGEITTTNKRSQKRGKVCDTWGKKELVSLAMYLHIPAPKGAGAPAPQRKDILSILRGQRETGEIIEQFEQMSDEELIQHYYWWRLTRTQICEALQQYFKEHDQLLVIE